MKESSTGYSSAKLVAAAATCAALYAIVNVITSPIRAPWGVGEFRPGVVIPAFYALIFGPIPAALGAGVGSFVGDMISLVATGGSNPTLAIVAGAPGNFLGFLIIGWVFQKLEKLEGIHHRNDYRSLCRKPLGSRWRGPFAWTAKCLDLGLSFVLVRDDVPLRHHSRSCSSSSDATLREPALDQSWLP